MFFTTRPGDVVAFLADVDELIVVLKTDVYASYKKEMSDEHNPFSRCPAIVVSQKVFDCVARFVESFDFKEFVSRSSYYDESLRDDILAMIVPEWVDNDDLRKQYSDVLFFFEMKLCKRA